MSIFKTLFGSDFLRRSLNKAARNATRNAPGPVRQVANEASNTVARKIQK